MKRAPNSRVFQSATYKEARRLYKLGLAIHWLHPKSKIPIESGWGTGERKSWGYLTETYIEGLNLGVRLGTPSKLSGKFLAVIDVDVKSKSPHHLKEALAAVRKMVEPEDLPMVKSGRGNGSRHYYCLTEKPFKTFNPFVSEEKVRVRSPSKKPSKKEIEELGEVEIAKGTRIANAWEISLYSDGRQVVLPPSIHPDSGEQYVWQRILKDTESLKVVSFDAFIGGEKAGVKKGELEGFVPVGDIDLEWLPISHEMRRAIKNGEGVNDRSGFLLKASTALLSAGLDRNEALSVLTDKKYFLGAVGFEHAQTTNRAKAAAWVYKYTFARVEEERNPAKIFGGKPFKESRKISEEEKEANAEELAGDSWRHDLDRTEKGKTRATLKNIDLIFSNKMKGEVFKKDLFANRTSYGVNTPWGGKAGEYLTDVDLILVKRWLADTEFGIEPATAAILEGTSLIAHRYRTHPVREWLTSLKWDGVSRIGSWLKDCCEAEAAEPYLSEISKLFLLAMVKRVFEPGCQWDYVLILEGEQGKYKSSIARAIASDKWFMDNLPDLKDKDAMLNLQGKWLIELGELTSIKRTDFNQVKAYLVRRYDNVRPHYGRITEDVPRQSVFIGTVNEGEYLKDPTGNRRYWPVKVGECNVDKLKGIRDQLFAETMHVYQNENPILMLGKAATAQAHEAQEDRRVDDDESEMREALLEFMGAEGGKNFDFSRFKTKQLFVGPFAPWGRWADKGWCLQIASQILRKLGFEKSKIKGQRIWQKSRNWSENGGHGGQGSKIEEIENDFF